MGSRRPVQKKKKKKKGVVHSPAWMVGAVLDGLTSGYILLPVPKLPCTVLLEQPRPLHGLGVDLRRHLEVTLLLLWLAMEVPPFPSTDAKPGRPLVGRSAAIIPQSP